MMNKGAVEEKNTDAAFFYSWFKRSFYNMTIIIIMQKYVSCGRLVNSIKWKVLYNVTFGGDEPVPWLFSHEKSRIYFYNINTAVSTVINNESE